tara:strand:+ start:527 stop:919 length:393 start_codon:yes stop_codon:yes gene_type:complete
MNIRLPGFEIREPVKRHPVRGAYTGAFAIGLIGVLAAPQYDDAIEVVVLRHVLGGLAAGLVVGGLLPYFRSRLVAGGIVAFATFVAVAIAWGPGPGLEIEALAFYGLCMGIVYGGLFWDYEVPAMGESEI